MGNDIVERLRRSIAPRMTTDEIEMLWTEAADENARLRMEKEAWELEARSWRQSSDLKAVEIERLRESKAVLVEIAEAMESHSYAHMTNGRDIGHLLDEIDRLRGELGKAQYERLEDCEAEIERLREELRVIAEMEIGPISGQKMQARARAALRRRAALRAN